MMSRLAYIFLWLLIFAIPLENIFVLKGLGTISRIVGAFALLFGLSAMIVEKRHRPISALHVSMVIFILWSVTSFFWSIDPEASKHSLITLGQLFAMVLLIWEFARRPAEQDGLIKAYVWGATVSCVGTIAAYQSGEQTVYLRYSALGFDPNDLGLVLAISLPMAWHLGLNCNGSWEKWLYRGYLPLAFFAIILTGSRGSFIASMVASVYVLWTIGQISKRSRLAIWSVLIGGSMLLVERIPTSSWARISTIGEELVNGSLNSRLQIWGSALEAIARDPLLGVGTGTFKLGIEHSYGVQISSHNLFLSIFLTLGMIGLLIFMSMLVISLIMIFCLPPDKFKFWLVLMATWFVGVMSLSWEFRKTTWFLLGLLVCQAIVAKGATWYMGIHRWPYLKEAQPGNPYHRPLHDKDGPLNFQQKNQPSAYRFGHDRG